MNAPLHAPTPSQTKWFRGFSVFALLYSLMVIVFGAWVRVTGSGAGCGQHWPTCHGVAIPREPELATIIEFTHRTTSGLCLVFVLVMLVLARRWFPKGHLARKWAGWSVFFMITEALVGAGLVIFGLVEDNDSVARAVSMTIHLVNTFVLTAAMTNAAYWGGIATPEVRAIPRTQAILLGVGAAALLVTSMTGAVTALGDTLYPVDVASQPMLDRLQLRGHEAAHFLIRLRILHPAFAAATGLYVAIITAGISSSSPYRPVQAWGLAASMLVLVQIAVGFLNIALNAPGWMQLTHLAIATLLWCSYVAFQIALRQRAAALLADGV